MAIIAQDATVRLAMNSLTIFNAEEFDVMQRFAKAMVTSGYFSDAKDIAQAFVKIQAGKELGMPPFASMTGIHVIQGKPALGANVIATLIKNDPRYNYRVLELTADICRIEFYENGEPCGVSEFTIAEAKKAGTKNLDKFPKNMLFARTLTNGAKWFTPGVFGGAPIYTPEELGADVDEEGNVVSGSFVVRHNDFDQTNPAADDDFNQDTKPFEDGKGNDLSKTEQYENEWGKTETADIRASLEEYPRMTGIQVADATIQTGKYNSRDHVESTLKKHHAAFKGKLSAGVERDVALEWFDFLMSYKEAAE